MLGHAAAETGGVATQNRGTIGGNIANASPAADTPPALLVYDAELQLISVRGRRRVPYDAFHLGYKKMDLAPDELIACVRLPKRASGWREHYRKVGTRKAQAISKVSLAARVRFHGTSGRCADVRIALGSVAPTVVRAGSAEGAIRGQRLDPAVIDAAVHALAQDIARSTTSGQPRGTAEVARACVSGGRSRAYPERARKWLQRRSSSDTRLLRARANLIASNRADRWQQVWA